MSVRAEPGTAIVTLLNGKPILVSLAVAHMGETVTLMWNVGSKSCEIHQAHVTEIRQRADADGDILPYKDVTIELDHRTLPSMTIASSRPSA